MHEKLNNTLETPRTVGCIALRPTGNAAGGYWFMNLKTGEIINRFQWKAIPMPQ